MDMWMATRPEYRQVLMDARLARAAFTAGLLRGAVALTVRLGLAGYRGLKSATRATGRALGRWHRRTATRRELGRMDDRMLSDIGLSRGDIERVALEMAERGSARPAPGVARPTGAETDAYGRAAHELRTPLTAIRSLSEIVRDNPGLSPAERRRFLSLVVDESRRLDQAIDGVLDRDAA
jgi:uncharacterized protein YjiS (DUF1127 family)